MLSNFVFPLPDNETAPILEALVKAIVHRQKENPRYSYFLHEQEEIDALVYDLYGLDADDIREVKLWFCRRYPLLAQAQGVLAEVNTHYADHLAHAARVMARPPSYWQSHPWLTLIAQGESATLENQKIAGIRHAERGAKCQGAGVALKTLGAFANADGGTY